MRVCVPAFVRQQFVCVDSRGHSFHLIFMKFGQNVYLDESGLGLYLVSQVSDSGPSWPSCFSSPDCQGSFRNRCLSVVRPSTFVRKHSRGHIYCPIFMKLGQKICPNDISIEFETGSCWVKN